MQSSSPISDIHMHVDHYSNDTANIRVKDQNCRSGYQFRFYSEKVVLAGI
jgi:hypothetical protein